MGTVYSTFMVVIKEVSIFIGVLERMSNVTAS